MRSFCVLIGGVHKRVSRLPEDDVEVGSEVHRLGEVAPLVSCQSMASALAHCLERVQQGVEQIDTAGVKLEAKEWVVDASTLDARLCGGRNPRMQPRSGQIRTGRCVLTRDLQPRCLLGDLATEMRSGRSRQKPSHPKAAQ